jgi:LexA-binding, inner membrane-associated putative hydrolase
VTDGITPLRRAVACADPLLHALLAGAVVAPLVPRAGRGPLLTAVAAGTLIDLDHPVAARSLRPRAMLSLSTRPPSHSLLVAVGAGALGATAGGPVHGWAAFGGMVSHLLRDAGDDAAPTPLFWPWAPARQIGRGWALAAGTVLALGSWAVSRASAGRPGLAGVSGADDGGAGARRRTASARS